MRILRRIPTAMLYREALNGKMDKTKLSHGREDQKSPTQKTKSDHLKRPRNCSGMNKPSNQIPPWMGGRNFGGGDKLLRKILRGHFKPRRRSVRGARLQE